MIDTHSHIYEPEFDADRAEAVGRALAAGVETMLLPAIDAASDERMFAACREFPDAVRPMMGLHPTSVNDNPSWRDELARVERYLLAPPQGIGGFCGVGEIGLDFYWSDAFRREQTEAFVAQVELSIKYGLPIAVHTRSAWAEMREIMRTFAGRGVKGVFHAFSDSAESYEELRTLGDFVFGIGGVVTFKKSPLVEVVRRMSIDDIVLETDCPYLTPVPHRGGRNESSYVRFVCDKIAEIKGMTAAEVAARTTANAERIFGKKNGSTERTGSTGNRKFCSQSQFSQNSQYSQDSQKK